MKDSFSRLAKLVTDDGIDRLSKARVAVFGLGGVGGHVVEALARSGIGTLGVIDNDVYTESNLNRQIFATGCSLGVKKASAAKERIISINPDCKVNTYDIFYLPETESAIDFSEYDYIVDAIDTVSAKIAIITRAKNEGIPVISCMGTGNKFDPTKLLITDIKKTHTCPLARIMRYELKQRGITDVKVVWSTEPPVTPVDSGTGGTEGAIGAASSGSAYKKPVPGSTAFVPGAAGLIIASEVIRDLLEI
ncbi:MAG: tRNA threonylcarbamoyladenosine dehydratase [Ruminococcus sp.]|jgi:tRNA A37 threonylcarbamoyladenosine dehydratase|nr:tRNA threonylcarbamoyladenosine dehydratase [Ruminococcus sp.]